MGIFDSIFQRNHELEWMYDFEIIEDLTKSTYLKRMVLNSCVELIARSIAQSEFRVIDNKKAIKEDIYYKLNVKPNTDSSSDVFWQQFVHKLIYDNEVLIIVNDTKDLLIADSFYRVELAMYDDTFKDVVVKDYKFQRSFKMDEVIYIKYNNLAVESIVDGLFEDYGEIFGRMINAQMRNYQIRGLFKVDSTAIAEKNRVKMETLRDKIFKSFSNNDVSIVPMPKGFEYEELSSKSSSNIVFSELTDVKKDLMADVANALGIPVGLINGDTSDLDKNLRMFEKFCLIPLCKKIQNELNAKLFTKNEYLKGKRIEMVGISKRNPLEYAESVDKLVSSGAFTRNEVRIMLGEEPSDDKELDTFLITKNYDKATKGGE